MKKAFKISTETKDQILKRVKEEGLTADRPSFFILSTILSIMSWLIFLAIFSGLLSLLISLTYILIPNRFIWNIVSEFRGSCHDLQLKLKKEFLKRKSFDNYIKIGIKLVKGTNISPRVK